MPLEDAIPQPSDFEAYPTDQRSHWTMLHTDNDLRPRSSILDTPLELPLKLSDPTIDPNPTNNRSPTQVREREVHAGAHEGPT